MFNILLERLEKFFALFYVLKIDQMSKQLGHKPITKDLRLLLCR